MKKIKTNYLGISVVIPTYNSSRTIKRSLDSIKAQEYPNNLIELIIVDGGSTDKTIETARKAGAKIIKVSSELQNAEYNKGIGINSAKNELLLMLDHDNILPHKMWLQNMIKPFLENNKIVGSEPLRFHHDKKMKIMDRYFALLGGTDPVAYYLGKNSHLSYIFDRYNLLGKAQDKGDYYEVKFIPNKLPALGGNGALVKKDLILKYAKSDPDNFFHIDVHVDLVNGGFNTYAIVKDSIMHVTHSEFFSFLQRRMYFVQKYYYEESKRRRYSVYNPKEDKYKLLYYIIISLTIVVPLFDSSRGFLKVRDVAWFIHPVMCFCMVFAYGIPVVKSYFKK